MRTAVILLALATAMVWGYLLGLLTPTIYGEPYIAPGEVYTKYSETMPVMEARDIYQPTVTVEELQPARKEAK